MMDFHLNFGVRNSIRSADNEGFTLVTPVYGGIGATDPNGASDPNGCLVRYVGSDVILSGNATDTTPNTWCTAGNSQGAFRAGPLSSQQMSQTPPPLANAWKQYNNLLGSGINFWAVDPHAMDNPEAFWKSLYPDTARQAAPGITWDVFMKELSGYLQASTSKGQVRHRCPTAGTLWACACDPHGPAAVTQHLAGDPANTEHRNLCRRGHPGLPVAQYTTDVLPAVNFALNMTDQLTLRLSYSKNMMPLNLSQWGGGPAAQTIRCRRPRNRPDLP